MKQKLLKTLVLLCALIVGSATSWADTAEFDFTKMSAISAGEQSFTSDPVTISCGNGAVALQSSTMQFRWYSSQSLTISVSSGYSITGISITKGANDKGSISLASTSSGTLSGKTGAGNGNVATWSGNATSVKFSSSGQSRVTNITVTYTSTGGGGSDPVVVTGVSLDKDVLDLTFGSNATLTATVNPDNATNKNVTWTSDNTSVATVDASGKVTTVAVGTATITVKSADDDTKSATCTVAVTAPEGKTTAAPSAADLWKETWDETNGTGGNDGSWNGTIASSTVVSDQTGWAYENAGGASHCLRVGTGSKKGTATTPAFGQAGDITVTFKAAAWDGGSEQTDLALSVVGTGTLDQESVAMTKGAFNSYEVTITGATAETKLKFAGKYASDSRFFLDDVVASTKGTIEATLNASGYATYCSEYPLDFSDYATADYSAWQVTVVSGDQVTFEQITESVKGGTGILLMGTPSTTVTLNSVASTNTLSTNKLVGTLAPTYVADNEYYGLSGNEFVKVNAGTVPAGKALLPAAEVGSVKALSFRFDGADGISEIIRNGENEKMSAIYDLSGRRVVKPTKGLYIVNGKKVVK